MQAFFIIFSLFFLKNDKYDIMRIAKVRKMDQKRFVIHGEFNDKLKLQLLNHGFIYDEKKPEYVFSLGGDGTMLDAIHRYMKLEGVKFVGVNYGKLGFYTDFVKEDADLVDKIIGDDYKTEEFRLLELSVNGNTYYALNEILVMNPLHTQDIEVVINDALLETFRGTGLVLSTPSGSTAYNKSLGGSILAPSIDGYQLTEMASINNRIYKTLSSSLVLARENVARLVFKNTDGLQIQVDGEVLDESDYKEVIIKLSEKKVKLVTRKDTLFLERVRKSFLE